MDEALQSRMSVEDEEAVQAELAAMEAEQVRIRGVVSLKSSFRLAHSFTPLSLAPPSWLLACGTGRPLRWMCRYTRSSCRMLRRRSPYLACPSESKSPWHGHNKVSPSLSSW